MKKLLVILVLSLAVVFSVSAQHSLRGGGFYAGPRVIVGGGWGIYGPVYPFYSPFWSYPPYGYGYYRPMSRLDMQISDIKYDYSEKMASVRQDKSLTHKQRRQKVRELKQERDHAVSDAKSNYYKH